MHEAVQLIVFILLLILASPVLGKYMANVFMGEKNILTPLLGRFERLFYSVSGIRSEEVMSWKRYLFCVLIFNFLGFVFLFLLLISQGWLPFNTPGMPDVSWHLSFNTAVSFVTNTNWQSYSGENTMSYLVQMLGLTVQNFVSAATGIAVALALIRGLTRKTTDALGNFWVDLTRSVIYVLLPLSIILTIVLGGTGSRADIFTLCQGTTLQGTEQIIPLGPAASQIAIKQLGTNGGGFFGANSAHPFENPTPFSNFLEMFSLIIISAGLVFTFGHYMKSKRQARAIFITMFILFALRSCHFSLVRIQS